MTNPWHRPELSDPCDGWPYVMRMVDGKLDGRELRMPWLDGWRLLRTHTSAELTAPRS